MLRRPVRVRDTFEIAGWLFADLLLALALLFTAVGGLGPAPALGGAGLGEAAPTQSASPTPLVGALKQPFCVGLHVDINQVERRNPAELARIRTRLAVLLRPLVAQKVSSVFVQTFGTARTIGRGVDLAHAVNDLLGEPGTDYGDVLATAALLRDFGYEHSSAALEGNVWIEIYVLNTKPAPISPCPDKNSQFLP